MKQIIFIIILLSWSSLAHTQNLIIQRNSERLTAVKVDEKIWSVQMDGEDYYILQKSTADSLTKKIARLNAIIERHEKVLAAQDTLLSKYAKFESKANRHIETQQALITTADSLFLGYKSLYQDVKKLLGLSTLSVVPGFAFVNPPKDNWLPALTMGVNFHQWLVQYHYGKDYRGIGFAYCLPVRW